MRVTQEQDRRGSGRNLLVRLATWWAGCPLRWRKKATSTTTQASHGVAAGTFFLPRVCLGREGRELTRRILRESDASEDECERKTRQYYILGRGTFSGSCLLLFRGF